MTKARGEIAVQLLQWCGAPGAALSPEGSPTQPFQRATWTNSSHQGSKAPPLSSTFLHTVQPSRLLRQSSSSVRTKAAEFCQGLNDSASSISSKTALPAVLNRRQDATRLPPAGKDAPSSPQRTTASGMAASLKAGPSDEALLPAISPQREGVAPQTWRALMPGFRDSMGANTRLRRASEASVPPDSASRDSAAAAEAQKAAHRRISEPGPVCSEASEGESSSTTLSCATGVPAAAAAVAAAAVQQQQLQQDGGGLCSERGGVFDSHPSVHEPAAGDDDLTATTLVDTGAAGGSVGLAGTHAAGATRPMAPAPPASQPSRVAGHAGTADAGDSVIGGASVGGVSGTGLHSGGRPGVASHPRTRRVAGQGQGALAAASTSGAASKLPHLSVGALPGREPAVAPSSGEVHAQRGEQKEGASSPSASSIDAGSVAPLKFSGFPVVLRCGGGGCGGAGLEEQRAGLRTPSALHAMSGRLLSLGMSDVSFKDWVDV